MGHGRGNSMMNEARLRELYTSHIATRRPTDRAACPAPEALQALVRREGAEEERLAMLDHAMSCADCRAEFDLLRSIEEAGTRLGAGSTSRRSWVIPAALAASLLLAVGVGRLALAPSEDDIVRGGPEGGAVALLSPPREAKAGTPLLFTWHAVPGATRYRLEVLSGDGDVALEAETTDTLVAPEAAVGLPAGEYQWWVGASVSPASRRSELRPLRLTR